MAAERIADRSEMCPPCDALVAGLSALIAERPDVLPSIAELRVRAGVTEEALIRHVGDPAGCFVLAFERATDRLYASAVAQIGFEPGEPSPGRLELAIRAKLDELDERTPAGAVILNATRLDDPAVREAVVRWQRRSQTAPPPAAASGGAPPRRAERPWRSRTAPERAPSGRR